MIPGRDFALDAGDGKRSSDGSGGIGGDGEVEGITDGA
jgi:hypothetical protein